MKDGVWRTVGGRRIFIKIGQDLASAMKESGKFGDNLDIKVKAQRILQLLEKQNELENELHEEAQKTFNKINDDELEALNIYETDGYFDINDHLNSKYEIPYGDEIVDNINIAIGKFNYDKEFTIYSGTKKYHYQNLKKGDIIDESRFISSSTNPVVAYSFAESEEKGLILKINRKKGAKGMYLGIGSTQFAESEYLLSNKQKYKVIGTDKMQILNKIFEVLEVDTYE